MDSQQQAALYRYMCTMSRCAAEVHGLACDIAGSFIEGQDPLQVFARMGNLLEEMADRTARIGKLCDVLRSTPAPHDESCLLMFCRNHCLPIEIVNAPEEES